MVTNLGTIYKFVTTLVRGGAVLTRDEFDSRFDLTTDRLRTISETNISQRIEGHPLAKFAANQYLEKLVQMRDRAIHFGNSVLVPAAVWERPHFLDSFWEAPVSRKTYWQIEAYARQMKNKLKQRIN